MPVLRQVRDHGVARPEEGQLRAVSKGGAAVVGEPLPARVGRESAWRLPCIGRKTEQSELTSRIILPCHSR